MEETKQTNQNPVNASDKKIPNTGMAVLGYIIFFIPLLTEAKTDPFVKYHVRQGFILFIACVVSMIIGKIPVIGSIASWALDIGILVLLVIGILNALNAKETPLPFIGKYAEKFQF